MRTPAIVLALILSAACAPAAAAAPATFQVGAATVSIDPPMPVPVGGFGISGDLTKIHDPLTVKAFYVSDGRGHAAAFAVVDCQAEFAAYQDGPDLGIAPARARAAREIGGGLTADAIIVQGTHSHAAPTLEGIWGRTPPEYLKLVTDRTVQALREAAARARPAYLEWGTADAPFLDNVDLQQTDSYQGWSQDGQLSVLRAVAPKTGETIATYVNVPAHPDIVNGASLKLMSADYFGAVRAALERRLGGTAIVGPATLGREETPVQTDGIEAMQWFAGVVSELSVRALRDARWVTQQRVSAASRHIDVEGANPALLALVAANHLPEEGRQALVDSIGQYPINRADTPPWLTGSIIGTDLTAVRIGPLAYLSMPGEPFPEVRAAIANATTDAQLVVALSKGQDDLGYFYPAFVYPFTVVYPSDHLQFNVAPQLGDQVILEQARNLKDVGFQSDYDVARPLPTRFEQIARPAVQGMASPAAGDAGRNGTFTTVLEGISSSAQTGSSTVGKLTWDLGDGTTVQTKSGERFAHAYPPGRYTISILATDERGRAAHWEIPVSVFPRLRARISSRGGVLRGSARGGRLPVLAWRWTFDHGPAAAGKQVRWPRRARRAVLRVTDTTGTVVRSSVRRAR